VAAAARAVQGGGNELRYSERFMCLSNGVDAAAETASAANVFIRGITMLKNALNQVQHSFFGQFNTESLRQE
jgi:hypothetical protein